MKKITDKLLSIEKTLSEENGPFDLFALFLREDAADKWDILVASDWIDQSKSSAIKVIAKKLQECLTKDELLILSRIVVIDNSNPALSALQSAIHVEHGTAEIKNSNLFGLQIKHAYLITSKQREAPPA